MAMTLMQEALGKQNAILQALQDIDLRHELPFLLLTHFTEVDLFPHLHCAICLSAHFAHFSERAGADGLHHVILVLSGHTLQ